MRRTCLGGRPSVFPGRWSAAFPEHAPIAETGEFPSWAEAAFARPSAATKAAAAIPRVIRLIMTEVQFSGGCVA
jgi:hypothetical protein